MYDEEGNLLRCIKCKTRDNCQKMTYNNDYYHLKCLEEELEITITYSYVKGKYISEWNL